MMGSVDRERRIAALEARVDRVPVCSEHALEDDDPIMCVVSECGCAARFWTPDPPKVRGPQHTVRCDDYHLHSRIGIGFKLSVRCCSGDCPGCEWQRKQVRRTGEFNG